MIKRKLFFGFILSAFVGGAFVSSQPATATEVVLIGCPEGLVVVSDKRGVAEDGRITDGIKKLKVKHTFLIAAIGGFFVVYLEKKRHGRSYRIRRPFNDILLPYASVAKHFSDESIFDPDVAHRLTDEICMRFKQLADCYASPWKLTETDNACCVIYVKVSPSGESIEVLKAVFGAREHASRNDGVGAEDCHEIYTSNASRFTFAKGSIFCKRFGITSPTQVRDSELQSTHGSRELAVEWAENEILSTHRQVRPQWVGGSVDEFLVRFDGTIQRLASNKQLEKSHN